MSTKLKYNKVNILRDLLDRGHHGQMQIVISSNSKWNENCTNNIQTFIW